MKNPFIIFPNYNGAPVLIAVDKITSVEPVGTIGDASLIGLVDGRGITVKLPFKDVDSVIRKNAGTLS